MLKTVAAVLACVHLSAACSSAPDPATLGELGWMTGCWTTADGASTQTWSPPAGGMMFGHGLRLNNGKAEFFETSYIDLRGPQEIYVTSPDGLRPASFLRMRPQGADAPPQRTVSFVNAERDFPQKITYVSSARDQLAAEVSMMDGSRAAQFVWTRCKR
jgi:hypothetical protein